MNELPHVFFLVGARDVYERAVEFFGEENADEKLFLAFGKFEENCKEVHDAVTRIHVMLRGPCYHCYSNKNVKFLHWFYSQHDRVRVIFQYALKILPKEECQVSAEIIFCNLW